MEGASSSPARQDLGERASHLKRDGATEDEVGRFSNIELEESVAASERVRRPWVGQEMFERMLGEVEDRVNENLGGHKLPLANYGLHYFRPQPALPRTDYEFEMETRSLKHNIKRYCKDFYGYEITDEERNGFNLADLARRNPELMEFVEFVADSGNNWKDIFTEGLYRWSLAYGVLCTVLQKWVFPHTMFGATEDQLSSVQNIDAQFLMRDGKSPLSMESNSPFNYGNTSSGITIQHSTAHGSAPR